MSGFVRESEYRHLTGSEREILVKLMEPDVEGCVALRLQLESVTARQIHEDGTLQLRCDRLAPSTFRYKVPQELRHKSFDRFPIGVLLHCDREGFMWLLEILYYRDPPLGLPLNPSDLELI